MPIEIEPIGPISPSIRHTSRIWAGDQVTSYGVLSRLLMHPLGPGQRNQHLEPRPVEPKLVVQIRPLKNAAEYSSSCCLCRSILLAVILQLYVVLKESLRGLNLIRGMIVLPRKCMMLCFSDGQRSKHPMISQLCLDKKASCCLELLDFSSTNPHRV
ncbi:hypothetical protein BDZ45DRAFT_427158 [Acephala macrosclerotiorum]|nr:hypothetical protein BDZ45DRAFT_427158 [Acephala macrosclerotiorum]